MITEKNNVFYCDCGFSFQRGRSGAHDCADGLRNKLAESEARCEALAAENAGLKESVEHAAGCIAAAEAEGLIDALAEKDGERLADLIHRRLCHAHLPVETPATDAFLAEVREQGIKIAINKLVALAPRLDKRAVETLSMAVEHLRKGVQS
ncbi:hypothetical protein ACXHH8_000819 [Enterobacter roggenkampii]